MKRINLIPEEAKKITPAKWVKILFAKSLAWRLAILAISGFVALNVLQAGTLLRYKAAVALGRSRVNKILEQLTDAQGLAAQIKTQADQVNRQTKYTQDKLDVLLSARTEKIAWAKTLERISHLVPQNLWVNKVLLNKQLITIVGTTFDNEVVSHFMAGLDDSGYFRETSFSYTKKAEIGARPVINFEVITHLVLEKALP